MPDEIIKYKIQIDDSDLASQLAGVRSQIDSSLAQNLSLSSPGGPSQAPAGIGSMYSDASSYSMQNTLGAASLKMYQTSADIATGASMGYNQIGTLSYNPLNTGVGLNPNNGFMDNFLAGRGLGYDYKSPYNLSEYRSIADIAAGKQFGSIVAGTLTEAPQLLAGFAVPAMAGSMAAGMGMTALGATGVGAVAMAGMFALDASIGYYTDRLEKRDEIGEGLFEFGQHSKARKNISKYDTEKVADWMLEYQKNNRVFDVDLEELSNNIMTFGANGGLTNSIDAKDFENKIKGVIENLRTVSKTLGIAQDEAAKLMAELEVKQIVSPAGAGYFAVAMNTMGKTQNISGLELTQTGLNTVTALQGSGLTEQSAFAAGVDARLEMQKIFNSSDPYYRTLAYNLGGNVDAAAADQLNLSMRLKNNAFGFINRGSFQNGGGTGGGLQYNINQTGERYSNPANYFKDSSREADIFSEMGPNGEFLRQLSFFRDIVNDSGLSDEEKKDPNVIIGFMEKITGEDPIKLRAAFEANAPSKLDIMNYDRIYGDKELFLKAWAQKESSGDVNVRGPLVPRNDGSERYMQGKYQFDPDTLRRMGYTGDADNFRNEEEKVQDEWASKYYDDIVKQYDTKDPAILAVGIYSSPAGVKAFMRDRDGTAANAPQGKFPTRRGYSDQFMDIYDKLAKDRQAARASEAEYAQEIALEQQHTLLQGIFNKDLPEAAEFLGKISGIEALGTAKYEANRSWSRGMSRWWSETFSGDKEYVWGFDKSDYVSEAGKSILTNPQSNSIIARYINDISLAGGKRDFSYYAGGNQLSAEEEKLVKGDSFDDMANKREFLKDLISNAPGAALSGEPLAVAKNVAIKFFGVKGDEAWDKLSLAEKRKYAAKTYDAAELLNLTSELNKQLDFNKQGDGNHPTSSDALNTANYNLDKSIKNMEYNVGYRGRGSRNGDFTSEAGRIFSYNMEEDPNNRFGAFGLTDYKDEIIEATGKWFRYGGKEGGLTDYLSEEGVPKEQISAAENVVRTFSKNVWVEDAKGKKQNIDVVGQLEELPALKRLQQVLTGTDFSKVLMESSDSGEGAAQALNRQLGVIGGKILAGVDQTFFDKGTAGQELMRQIRIATGSSQAASEDDVLKKLNDQNTQELRAKIAVYGGLNMQELQAFRKTVGGQQALKGVAANATLEEQNAAIQKEIRDKMAPAFKTNEILTGWNAKTDKGNAMRAYIVQTDALEVKLKE